MSSIGHDLQRLLIDERAAHERTKADFEEACKRLAFVVNERDAAVDSAYERDRHARETLRGKLASVEAELAETRAAVEKLTTLAMNERAAWEIATRRGGAVMAKLASIEAVAKAARNDHDARCSCLSDGEEDDDYCSLGVALAALDKVTP